MNGHNGLVGRSPFPALIVNRFFYSMDGGEYCRPGKVIDGLLGDHPLYLVQWFSWLDMEPTFQQLVPLSIFVEEEWPIYETVEAWQQAGDAALAEAERQHA